MSYQAIKDLVGYALRTGLIDEYDRPWAVNELLQAMTFFLGVSLTLGSLCGAVGRLAIGSDYAEWWQNDWQETPVFRNRISNDLESFLAIGVGRTVDWYHPDYSVEDTASGTGTIWFFADTPTASCETSFVEAQDTSPRLQNCQHSLRFGYPIVPMML